MPHTGYYSGLSDYQNANDVLVLAEEIKDEAVAAQVLATAAAVTSQNAIDLIQPNITAIQQAGANATSAANSAASASTNATLAQRWATNPVDVPVTTGLYSAFHWAQKAQAVVTGGLDTQYLRIDGNLGNIQNPATARTNLGLGTAATLPATAFQPASTKLANWVATTNTADSINYNTSATTYAVTALTTVGRNVIGAADALAGRNALGLGSIATAASGDYQATTTKLTNLLGTTNTADSMVYATGASTYAVTPLTPAARTVLDDTTTTAMCTTLNVHTKDETSSRLVKAWVMFNGATAGSPSVDSGFNVGSVTKTTTGRWTINFVTAVAFGTDGSSYAVIGCGVNIAAAAPAAPAVVYKDYTTPANVTPTSCPIAMLATTTPLDKTQVFAMVLGNGPVIN